MSATGTTARPGDEIVPAADLVFDRGREIGAAAETIWPWLLQLGKRRAGWYLPRAIERVIPPRRRALRHLDARHHDLRVGQRIPDYGGRGAELEVARIDPPHTLVYRDQRRGAQFSWAITLTPTGPHSTRVDLRFRGQLRSTGIKRRLIAGGAELFDALTAEAMLRGLRERVEITP